MEIETALAHVDVAGIKRLGIIDDIAAPDTMGRKPAGRDFYFFVGRQNLFTIFNLLNIRGGFITRRPRATAILDFGSGYGRVTRWLRAGFPRAEIHVTDIDMGGPRWCAERLGAVAVDAPVPEHYDLIWVGSVFTHLAQDAAASLMAGLLGALAPSGILAITTLGRTAKARMQNYDWAKDRDPGWHFNLEKPRFDALIEGFEADGYGYVPYPGVPGYGMCMAKPAWYSALALESNAITQIALIERADGAQDVSAFLRLDLTDPARGLLAGQGPAPANR